jgi:hypothetical protein
MTAQTTDLDARVTAIKQRVAQGQQVKARREHEAEQAHAALTEVARQLEEFGPDGTDYAAVLDGLDKQLAEKASAVAAALDGAGL